MAFSEVDFLGADLASRLDQAAPEQIDQLPFGCVRIGADGTVLFYSRREAQLSGRGSRATVGLDFFAEVAPCMNTSAVRGRIEKAMAAGVLSAEFNHVGDFADRDRELHMRAVSAAGGGLWLAIRRETA